MLLLAMVNPTPLEDPLIPHPSPPEDFRSRELPTVSSKGTWYRLNDRDFTSSLYFDRSGSGRFDSPAQGYGILYVGADVCASWIECYGRSHGAKGVSEIVLRQRNLFAIDSQRELVFADVTGNGLVKMGADARLSSGSYVAARQWAQAIYDHPQVVDGIRYRSRHDDERYCYGIFDRVASPSLNRRADELQEKNLGNLLESNAKLLAEILNFYDYGLF
jgi:RES domain